MVVYAESVCVESPQVTFKVCAAPMHWLNFLLDWFLFLRDCLALATGRGQCSLVLPPRTGDLNFNLESSRYVTRTHTQRGPRISFSRPSV